MSEAGKIYGLLVKAMQQIPGELSQPSQLRKVSLRRRKVVVVKSVCETRWPVVPQRIPHPPGIDIPRRVPLQIVEGGLAIQVSLGGQRTDADII